MKNLAKLTLEQLQARLEELNVEWQAVEQAIEERKDEDKKELAEEIRSKVMEAGYDVAEILSLIATKKGRSKKSNGAYTRYIDPDDSRNVYVRGVLPIWLKDKMKAKGFDPSVKADRDHFKEKHLRRVAA